MNQLTTLVAAILMAGASVQAAEISLSKTSWGPSVPPAPVNVVSGLQGYLKSPAGVDLLRESPALGLLAGLSVDSPAHLRMAGALLEGVPHQGTDAASLSAALTAAAAKGLDPRIEQAATARAEAIAKAVEAGELQASELFSLAGELRPLASISAAAAKLVVAADTAKTDGHMANAQKMAAFLLKSLWSDESLATQGPHGGFTNPEAALAVSAITTVPMGVFNVIPKDWRLKPASKIPIRRADAASAVTKRGPLVLPAAEHRELSDLVKRRTSALVQWARTRTPRQISNAAAALAGAAVTALAPFFGGFSLAVGVVTGLAGVLALFTIANIIVDKVTGKDHYFSLEAGRLAFRFFYYGFIPGMAALWGMHAFPSVGTGVHLLMGAAMAAGVFGWLKIFKVVGEGLGAEAASDPEFGKKARRAAGVAAAAFIFLGIFGGGRKS